MSCPVWPMRRKFTHIGRFIVLALLPIYTVGRVSHTHSFLFHSLFIKSLGKMYLPLTWRILQIYTRITENLLRNKWRTSFSNLSYVLLNRLELTAGEQPIWIVYLTGTNTDTNSVNSPAAHALWSGQIIRKKNKEKEWEAHRKGRGTSTSELNWFHRLIAWFIQF